MPLGRKLKCWWPSKITAAITITSEIGYYLTAALTKLASTKN